MRRDDASPSPEREIASDVDGELNRARRPRRAEARLDGGRAEVAERMRSSRNAGKAAAERGL